MIDQRKFIKLKRFPHSRHDISHRKTFGDVPLELIPKELDLSWPPILSQGVIPKCTAETAVVVRGKVKQKHYDDDAFWEAEKQMLGNPNADGSDLDTQGAVGVGVGFVPQGTSLPIDKADATADVTPSKGYDMFDACRSAMAQRLTPLSAGFQWYADWDHTPDGVIPNSFRQFLGGHNSALVGMTVKNGEDMIRIQGSWGEAFGEAGFFYLNRAMANKVLRNSVKYWVDGLPPETQKLGFIAALLQNVLDLLTRLFITTGRGLGFTGK